MNKMINQQQEFTRQGRLFNCLFSSINADSLRGRTGGGADPCRFDSLIASGENESGALGFANASGGILCRGDNYYACIRLMQKERLSDRNSFTNEHKMSTIKM